MRIAVGSDHRGYSVRSHIIELLTQLGHEVVDVGTDSPESIDYTDIAAKAAKEVGSGQSDMGILVCGTGLGMSIAANKFAGVRAAPCHDALTAEMSRRHNDLNVLCLAAEMVGAEQQEKMTELWLSTPFEGGRHERRVSKIAELEAAACAERTG